ncbi:MAG TPA: ABC transporter permease [Terriglobales bacterium]|nr:ABC transporter permease [Terriglobales bacterium]
MAIPISYNIRNLRLRLGATVMTALGIALTVAIAIFIMALLSGLKQAFASTGNALNVMAMRKGSDSELSSIISREQFGVIKDLPGIAKDSHGDPLASGEMMVAIVLPRSDGTGETNVSVRGMNPVGFEMRPEIKLVEGRWFATGQREVVVSRSISKRFANANIGNTLQFGKGLWTVVGVFDGAGSAHDSEIWADVNQMASDFDRPVFSSVVLQASDAVAADALANRLSDDQRLKLDGMSENSYFDKQTRSGAAIKFVGTLVAIIMAIGSCFAAMNTMYAAVAYRGREIATLRVLGFSRPSILTSFVFEALLISLVGAVIAVILMLPFNGLTTGTSNQVTFSEVIFQMRMTPAVIATAILFAALMGVLGGLAPAWHAARQNILAALRG